MEKNTDPETEVAVIGAGPGGYVAAIRLGQLGHDVTLIEADALGGVCLNYGCIPSKAVLSATRLAERAESASRLGIEAEVSVDVERMIDWKDRVVKRLTGGVGQLCQSNGVEVIEGRARFEDSQTLTIDGPEAPDHLSFEEAIIATGSRPIELPGFSFEDEPIWSSREALDPPALPDRLLVVGAGYIGMELSIVYARFGTDVTIVEALEEPLPGFEADVTDVVVDRAKGLGIDIHTGQAASTWEDHDGGVTVTTSGEDDSTETYETDRILVAVGREPLTETVNLDAVGVATNEDGAIEATRTGATNVDGIYAIGDVTGEPMLAHAASKEGIFTAHAIDGSEPDPGDWVVPAAVFTDPEIATVGFTEAEAEAAGFDPVVGQFPFRANGRAMTADETDGFVRIVADGESTAVLGAQIVGPDASELIAELTFAIRERSTLADIGNTIHVHPTLSEAVMEAAEQGLGHAIHTVN